MVLFPVINEACRVLEEGIVDKASDLDIASIFGMGFPSYRSVSYLWSLAPTICKKNLSCLNLTRLMA
jgi:hypothetical protein